MPLQLKRDQLGRDLCPRCNSVLFEAGDTRIRLFHASFPDELPTVYLLILGGADIYVCPVCTAEIQVPSPAFCLI
ncbi:MAG TPA: hypothetical protein VK581_05425, partial [Chthoniobacterales bacterium]|nr:hypothetical protein [Chthoniobacterales bacterium]